MPLWGSLAERLECWNAIRRPQIRCLPCRLDGFFFSVVPRPFPRPSFSNSNYLPQFSWKSKLTVMFISSIYSLSWVVFAFLYSCFKDCSYSIHFFIYVYFVVLFLLFDYKSLVFSKLNKLFKYLSLFVGQKENYWVTYYCATAKKYFFLFFSFNG